MFAAMLQEQGALAISIYRLLEEEEDTDDEVRRRKRRRRTRMTR